MIPQNESKEVRVLRQYINDHANLTLTVRQLQIDNEDKDAEIAELRRLNQELQAQLNERNASETEA